MTGFVSASLPFNARPLATDAASGSLVFVIEDLRESVTMTRTRSKPWQLGHGEWVVLLEGRTGGFKLSRCFDASELQTPPWGPKCVPA